MWKGLAVVLAVVLAMPLGIRAQDNDNPGALNKPLGVDDSATKNAAKAREVLDAMVKAMGGDQWLNLKNTVREGHIAAFFHGEPDVGTTLFWEFHEWPDHDRFEYTKHRDVVQFYVARKGIEITYRGAKDLPKDQVDDFMRRRDHSIETAVKVWMKDPKTIFLYEGQRMAERHMADQVTLISPENESITIQMDVQTHLPLSRSFQWRDPVYKDKNTDVEEYADYHDVNGLPTAYSITLVHNDETVRQVYIDKVHYNQDLPEGFWDINAVARKIKK
jgi:predicted secreted protein